MRSRYTAYTQGDWKYIHKTWHPDKRPSPASLRWQGDVQWIGLKVLRSEAGQVDDDQGTVEFVATFKTAQGIEQLHETSRFVKEKGKWLYVDGELSAANLEGDKR